MPGTLLNTPWSKARALPSPQVLAQHGAWLIIPAFLLLNTAFLFFGLSLANQLFAVLVVICGYCGLMQPRLSRPLLLTLGAYGLLLAVQSARGLQIGTPPGSVFKQVFLYVKPALFFLAGYYLLDQRRWHVMLRFVLAFMLVGSLAHWLWPHWHMTRFMDRLPMLRSVQQYFSFNNTWLRNGSWLLSPLDTGFVGFLLTFHYYTRVRQAVWGWLHFALAATILVSTATRSAWIGTLVAIALYHWMGTGRQFKLFALGGGALLVLVVVGMKAQALARLVEDGSFNLHLENLHMGARGMLQYGLTGRGISMYNLGNPEDLKTAGLYSEGSLITSIIENGVAILAFYALAGWLCFKMSWRYLFPIFAGFCVAGLMIQIGFSTAFAALFYSAMGFMARRYFRES